MATMKAFYQKIPKLGSWLLAMTAVIVSILPASGLAAETRKGSSGRTAATGTSAAPTKAEIAAQKRKDAEYDLCMRSARRASQIFDAKVKEFGGVNSKAITAAFKEIRKLPGVLDAGKSPVDSQLVIEHHAKVGDGDWFWLRLSFDRKRFYIVGVPDGIRRIPAKSTAEQDRDLHECFKALYLENELANKYIRKFGAGRSEGWFTLPQEQILRIPNISEASEYRFETVCPNIGAVAAE